MRNKAVVVGALEVIGRYIVERLVRSPIGKLWGCRDERRRMGHSIVTCPSIYLTPKTRNASSQG